MKLKDSEKSALIILLAAAVAVACFMLVIKPKYEETQLLKEECMTLQQRLDELQQKQARRDEYLAGIDEFNEAFEKEMHHFAPDLNQEVTVMFLEGIKDNNDFEIASLSLGQPELFYTLGSNGGDASIGGEEAPAAEGETADTAATDTGEAAADGATEAVASEGSGAYECYRADFPISYSGSYESLKDVVDYVNNYEDRMTINSINIAYTGEDESYSGSIDLKCYAIMGPDRPETSMEMNEIETGTDNIFHGANGTSSSPSSEGLNKYDENDGAAIENSYDFYAMINPSSSDVSAKVVGQNGTGKDASVISNSDNSVSTLNYEIYETDGKVYCKYTLDNSTSYEAEVTSAEDIKLLIQSSARKNDDDKVGVKINIKNSSSLPVYVKVTGDDSVSPRVSIAGKSGSVKVY